MKCLFCDFVSGKRKTHIKSWNFLKKEYPFIKILETKLVICFLSHPNLSGHSEILVIPKQHIEFIEDAPKNILNELIKISAKIAGILRKKYSGSNILLNNGKNGHQYIPHVHFHIIPKNKHKKNPWKRLNQGQFKKLSLNLKKELNQNKALVNSYNHQNR